MRTPFAVLYKGKIFSKAPNKYGCESELLNSSFQKQGDTYFLTDPFWSDDILESSNNFDIRNKLFIFDPIETYFRNERIKNSKEIKLNLSFAKKVIVDEHFPVFQEFWPEENTFIDENGIESGIPGIFYISGGRMSLLKMIRENRYSEALPELREIALNDDCIPMRIKATLSTGPLEREKADKIVNEVLGITNDRHFIMDICHYIMKYSLNNLFIQNLRKKFEEHYLDYVDRYLALKFMRTVPQSIISACGSILTIDSLLLIEEGIKHPYPHVEKNAKHALYMWTERVVKNKIHDEKLMQKAIEICKKYDMGNYFQNSSWQYFKKNVSNEPVSY